MKPSRISHGVAFSIGWVVTSVIFLSFALGEIQEEASGRGSEFDWLRMGQSRAKDIVYWDFVGLSNFGWRTARCINRGIGRYSGFGDNFARRWVLASGCDAFAIGAGGCAYLGVLVVARMGKP